jgi:hypothetical protein
LVCHEFKKVEKLWPNQTKTTGTVKDQAAQKETENISKQRSGIPPIPK